jgi:putative protein kinase ArgK-like GTPase of G3E family
MSRTCVTVSVQPAGNGSITGARQRMQRAKVPETVIISSRRSVGSTGTSATAITPTRVYNLPQKRSRQQRT